MSTSIDLSKFGVGAPFDSNSIISGLVQAELQPVADLQTQEQNIQAASSTFSQLSSKLSALKSAAVALSDVAGFSSYSASSTDSTLVASVTGAATAGNHTVSVSALAAEQRTYSDAQPSGGALGMAGTLSIQVGGGKTYSVNVASGDALSDIAAKINASGARVNASVLFDGTTYRLQVAGLDTGAANSVTFGESGLSLGLTKAANTYQKASDASLSVDGIAITRPTNQVSGVIAGVTLALTKTTTTPAVVQVSSDATSVHQKLAAFVSAYNAVVAAGHSAEGYGSTKATNPLLSGDSDIRAALNQVSSVFRNAVPGATGQYTTLGSVGVEIQTDGTLMFDSTKFDAAMQADPSSVQKLFVTDSSIGATGVMSTLGTAVDALTTGASAPIASRITGFGKQVKSINDKITALQDHATQYQTTLQKQFAAMNTVVAQYASMANALAGFFSNGSSSK